MNHSLPTERASYRMLENALESGWMSVDTIPLAGQGEFLVLTMSGLVRRVKNRKKDRRTRKADPWGPARTTVVAVDSGNYLAAIAWRYASLG